MRLQLGKELNFINNFELQLYHLLGVQQFRKAILWLEKIKHHGMNRRNENYHLSNFDLISLERYTGFLVYNAFLHCISLIFTVLYLILSITINLHNVVVDVIIIVLTIINVYCIILQRATYLKLKEQRLKCYKKFLRRIDSSTKEKIKRVYARKPQELQDDYEVLARMKNAFEHHSDCVLTAADSENLKRICQCIEPKSKKKPAFQAKENSEVSLIGKCNSISGPYTKLQMRTDWLQRKLGLPGVKMLDRTVIITEDAECEALYKKLVPEDTTYNMYFACVLLHEIFTQAVDKVRHNET